MAGAPRARGRGRDAAGSGWSQLAVRVQPGARGDGLIGWMADGTLKLRVAAAPEDGRANRAVEALLARVLELGTTQVVVARGTSSRAKVIEVHGLDAGAVRARLDAALSRTGARDGD